MLLPDPTCSAAACPAPVPAPCAEMVDEKGLPPAVADRIGEFVVLRGEPMALLDKLSAEGEPASEPASAACLGVWRGWWLHPLPAPPFIPRVPACSPSPPLLLPAPAAHLLSQHPDSAAALAELRLLFGFLEAMGALQPIVFDLRCECSGHAAQTACLAGGC